jgi:hypothetical protein
MSALDKQEGGTHYKDMPIQPIEFITKNKLDWYQGNIVKYASRHHNKGGADDLRKVIHYAELALEAQYGQPVAIVTSALNETPVSVQNGCMRPAPDEATMAKLKMCRDPLASFKRLDVEGQAQHDTRDDGWIEWKGGDCPVPKDATVQVEYRGYSNSSIQSNHSAGILEWNHLGIHDDIIKYRVVK